MLWIEKYSPKRLEDLSHNHKINKILKVLSQTDDFPHLLFHGQNGSGKRTRIRSFIRSKFGDKALHLKTQKREFKKPNKGTVAINIRSSTFHLEVTPSDIGMQDKLIVNQLIKQVASSQSFNYHMTSTFADECDEQEEEQQEQENKDQSNFFNIEQIKQQGQNLEQRERASFNVVVLHQVDKLSHQAQAGLRRTMEKYMGNCRIIMDCECISKVIAPLRSRVMQFRVASPTVEEIHRVLTMIGNREKLYLEDQWFIDIAQNCNRNLRRAIMTLQSSYSMYNNFQNKKVKGDGVLWTMPPYQVHIKSIVDGMLKQQSVQSVKGLRVKLYEAIVKLIPSTIIFRLIIHFLKDQISQSILSKVVPFFAKVERRCKSTAKDIYHLQAGIVKFMEIYIRQNSNQKKYGNI